MERRYSPRRFWLWLLHSVAALVLFGALALAAIFDFSRAAFPYDEENTEDGRPVAIGPHPWEFVCPPTYFGITFDGTEWPFVRFAAVCAAWRTLKGYAPPAELRLFRGREAGASHGAALSNAARSCCRAW